MSERPTLRPYQNEAIDLLRTGLAANVKAGEPPRQVLCLPTGSGKTCILAEMIRLAAKKGNRALFVVDRKSLIDQTMLRLHEWGVESDPWHGDAKTDSGAPVVVATYQTWRRSRPERDFDMLVFDECHVRARGDARNSDDVDKDSVEYVGAESPAGDSSTPIRTPWPSDCPRRLSTIASPTCTPACSRRSPRTI